MKVVLQKDVELGSGGFGTVYRAIELQTRKAVVLKNSRVSKRIRRPALEHEVRVLRMLAGHPAIPQVFGYGRINHFELMTMQLLGKSLGDIVDEEGPRPVATVFKVADQLIAALEHLLSRGLVHRDIKPDNILLQAPGSDQVCLVDFGLTYPVPSATQVTEYNPPDPFEPTIVFGTLSYASLNAHKTSKLTYRDDLESLAYTLIYLLHGKLPWSYYTRHGTLYGRKRQVYAQKRRLVGSQLSADFPKEFGELVDYARKLPPDGLPCYQEQRTKLRRAAEIHGEHVSLIHNQMSSGLQCNNSEHGDSAPASSSEKGESRDRCQQDFRPSPPVQPGLIAPVKLITSITAEGYSIQAGHESSYIRDPRFETSEWISPFRPCLILAVEWDDQAQTYKFTGAPISNQEPVNSNPLVPISSESSPQSETMTIRTQSKWLFPHSYCYAFRRLTKFYCLPSQIEVQGTWSIDPVNIEAIVTRLSPPRNNRRFASLRDSKSSDPDVRHDAKMRTGYVKLYAQVLPLTSIDPNLVDWNSTRGWFDECVKASKYYDMCNGHQWTDPSPTQKREDSGSGENVSNSYHGEDIEEWENRQQERDQSITLAGLEAAYNQYVNEAEELAEVELVDQ